MYMFWMLRKQNLIDERGPWIIDMYIFLSLCIYYTEGQELHVKDYYAPINLYFLCSIQTAAFAPKLLANQGRCAFSMEGRKYVGSI